MRHLTLSALVLAAALSAAPAAPAAIVHPRKATDVVVRVGTGGGFVPVQVNLRALPSFTLYGDGTVIVPGPVIQIYPGPAIYPLVRSRLSEHQVQALLRRAQAAGLLARGSIGYGDMGAVGVSDMPTTTLIVNARGRHVERAAYALGATGDRRLRRPVPGPGPARCEARRLAAAEQPRDGRHAPDERPALSLHHRARHVRDDAARDAAQGQRAVAVGGTRRGREQLSGDRAPAAPGSARLRGRRRVASQRTPGHWG
jgi:hypothetical protein